MIKKEVKQKPCRICKTKFTPFKSTDVICAAYNCRVSFALQHVQKVRKEKEREAKVAHKKLESELTDWRAKLQTKNQEISRIIDKGLKCLARDYFAKQLHGGHIFAKGGNKSMALNLHNIHRQSAQSNHFQNDDGLLREGVIREYGQEYMDFISDLRRTPSLHYANWEYQAFYEHACKIANRLKKADNTYNLEERIQLRNEINLELGIYDKEYCVFEQ